MTVDAPLPADARERAAALDPTRSFCVTAPVRTRNPCSSAATTTIAQAAPPLGSQAGGAGKA